MLDAKGRFGMPARHREVLRTEAQGQLTLTRHPEGCLMLFALPVWRVFRDRLAAVLQQPMPEALQNLTF